MHDYGIYIWIVSNRMAHDHSHRHNHHHDFTDEDRSKNILSAFWLNTLFAIIEVVGGLYTNSVAILSDAVHDFGDSLSLGLAYYFHKKSKQKRDSNYSYGYRRFSLLGAIINSVVLTVSCVFILRESILRLFHPEQPDARGMVVLAVIGIAINGLALLRLKKGKSINERVISLHFIEDVLGWVAVLIGSVVMIFVDVPVLDPLLSIAIAVYILYNVFNNIRATLRILLQGRPENIDETDIRTRVLAVPGVKDMHDLHYWTLDGQYNILTLHVVVNGSPALIEAEKIKSEIKHTLQHNDVHHITLELEPEENQCTTENIS